MTGTKWYHILPGMVSQIAIKREARGGERAEILDVAEFLRGEHGSATNALAVMVLSSPTFIRGQRALRKNRQSRKKRGAP